jgi:hypothetical protein
VYTRIREGGDECSHSLGLVDRGDVRLLVPCDVSAVAEEISHDAECDATRHDTILHSKARYGTTRPDTSSEPMPTVAMAVRPSHSHNQLIRQHALRELQAVPASLANPFPERQLLLQYPHPPA